MFAIAFFSILFPQWQLRQNLEEMRSKNNQMLMARRAYQRALDAKEAENNLKLKILQNRKKFPLYGTIEGNQFAYGRQYTFHLGLDVSALYKEITFSPSVGEWEQAIFENNDAD